VFPVDAQKRPLTTHGHLDATTDADVIEGWRWRAGIGWSLPAGILVVDVDARHRGDESLVALERANGRLPLTLTQYTGGGGLHLIYRVPAGRQARQLAPIRSDLPGLDTRVGGRGYIVLPPSLHMSGLRYGWRDRAPIADAPPWLLDLVCPRPRANYVPPPSPADADKRTRYARRALEGEARAVARTGEGGRNHRLYAAWRRCAGDLGDVLPRELVVDTLTRAGLAAGLEPAEIARTLR